MTWTRWDVYGPRDDGSYAVEMATNDDNDDGYPDPEVERDSYQVPTLERAMKLTGRTRLGFAGHRVEVFLNGEAVR